MNYRRCMMAQGLSESLSILDALVHFFTMIEVVGKRSVDLSECQVVFRGNLVHALSKTFVPNGNILDSDSVSTNTGLPTRNTRRNVDVSVKHLRCHSLSPALQMILQSIVQQLTVPGKVGTELVGLIIRTIHAGCFPHFGSVQWTLHNEALTPGRAGLRSHSFGLTLFAVFPTRLVDHIEELGSVYPVVLDPPVPIERTLEQVFPGGKHHGSWGRAASE